MRYSLLSELYVRSKRKKFYIVRLTFQKSEDPSLQKGRKCSALFFQKAPEFLLTRKRAFAIIYKRSSEEKDA